MMLCVIFNSAAPAGAGPLMATRRGCAAQEEKRSPTRTMARNPNVRSFTVTIPAVCESKAIKGCTARIVPDHSARVKRNQSELEKRPLRLLEIALVLVRFDDVALTDSTHFRIFPRNLEPDFTHYLYEQRKENGNL